MSKLIVNLKLIFFSILTIDIFVAGNDPSCGVKGPKPPLSLLSKFNPIRIIGGEEALPGEFPWQCSLRLNDKHFCGGSIINSRFILTAGHCVIEGNRIVIVCGSNTISPSSTEVQAVAVKQIRHPQYNFPQNDIALIKLDHDLDLTLPTLGSVCLPEPNESLDILVGKNTIAAGWGITENEKLPDKLHKVVLEVWKQKDCAKVWKDSKYHFSITNNHICLGKNRKSNCYMDSGSCLVHFNATTKRWTNIGVTSFGSGTCHGPEPSVDTRVSTFVKWIWDTVTINSK